MDAQTAAALAGKAAQLNVSYTLFALLLIVGVATLIMFAGEKALGLNLRNIVDAIEDAAKLYITSQGNRGTVWPAVVSFFVVPASLLGVVLYIGLH